jgi:hypothetical protein
MARTQQKEAQTMATGETGFEDVTYDLISVQYHALKAGHDYGQYVRDAENAGLNDIAQFFRDTMKDDSSRAARAHELLKNISGTDQAGTGRAVGPGKSSGRLWR